MSDPDVERFLERAITRGRTSELSDHLVTNSGLPGPRMNLGLVDAFADAVADLVTRPGARVKVLAELLDGWAALSPDEAPGDQPEVILPCAAVLCYGAAGAARPEWRDHELAKVRRAASDSRWRVREMVAMTLQRMLAAEWTATIKEIRAWASDGDPLVVRAAAAAVAEPPLLGDPGHAADALAVQELAVASLRAVPASERRSENVRVLRQGLAYTVSVAVAATGDFAPLEAMATSGDRDLAWAAKQNLAKARLKGWPDEVTRLRALLE